MAEFTMPSLGADMDEGTLQEWLVSPGDTVRRGDVVAVVETDKSTIEVECFEAGTVGRLLIGPGTKVPVGTPLAVIESAAPPVVTASREPSPAGEPTSVSVGSRDDGPHPSPTLVRAPAGTGPLVRQLAARKGVDLTAVHGTGRGGRVTRADVERAGRPVGGVAGAGELGARTRATPYARRLAAELQLDLAALRGSGENGAVRAADVRAAVRLRDPAGGAEATATTPTPADSGSRPGGDGTERRGARAITTTDPLRPAAGGDERAAAMRRAIGALMARSNREIPHYYLSTTIDLKAATDWLHRHNRERPVGERLVPAALLLKAAAVAARRTPELNGFWRDGHFVPGEGVHLAVAVSLRDGGLLTPVLHDADQQSPSQLMAMLKDLVRRARQGRLRGSELSGATLTVTNLGDQGAESVFGVIHPPQVALVGFGAVSERPWAVDGLLGVRPVVTATLSADHRATDGAVGARMLHTIAQLLHSPEELT
ncbi:2-oxo acid dehydrogenase subunit E2 [Streptomyces sp. KL118A]|uniref:2-oxo acid dehydrogenase subunit E2 n=1 Tax=Streptomyces sp. KL118A TaxID=3045153 RepID=UPI00278BE956|nr:2-oxo acid dehydrogenase subunit E2 [Streptomyces sp. KL118A]